MEMILETTFLHYFSKKTQKNYLALIQELATTQYQFKTDSHKENKRFLDLCLKKKQRPHAYSLDDMTYNYI
jgi:hypothetical protein